MNLTEILFLIIFESLCWIQCYREDISHIKKKKIINKKNIYIYIYIYIYKEKKKKNAN